MDFVMETPVKRRKLGASQFSESQSYDSQDDSGDDLLADYETIATLPVAKKPVTRNALDILSSSPPYTTQPTQIIDPAGRVPETPEPRSSSVQVVASSPLKSPSTLANFTARGGLLASSMAPPGTAFRLPLGVTKRPSVQEISDDDDNQIQYQGGSSDEESQGPSHIKPSTFTARSQALSKLRDAQTKKLNPPADGLQKFKEITSKSFYKPLDKKRGSGLTGSVFDSRNRDESNTSSVITASKRSADIMANAYGGSSRPAKQIRQTAPAKAMPVPETLYSSPDDIEDDVVRRKVIRMKSIMPGYSVDTCYGVLALKKGNVEDALDYMTTFDDGPIHIDLTSSPIKAASHELSSPPQPTAKQQVRASQTIQEKYASTLQGIPRNTQVITSSPIAPPKPRRRLVKGRKNRSSPISSLLHTPPSLSRDISPESVDSADSAIELEPEDNTQLESDLLNFFNTCSPQDLADIATITENLATLVIEKRPFRSLEEVRQVSTEPTPATATKKTRSKRPEGEKIVNTCETMWTGYEAVDNLVDQCNAIGKPLTEEMQKWGLDVFGMSKGGELELVSFDDIKTKDQNTRSSLRDSGIGTPSISGDEDDIYKSSRIRGGSKRPFFPQPSIMSPDVTLKDYQIVGINWLSLMFENKLSCILADDMGLGKTCQVIAFLAHLFEKGITGPHVVIVPGSTLENWLREFQVFCPVLNVMPYYDGKDKRPEIAEKILASADTVNVVITTYTIAKAIDDLRFLRRLKPCVTVFDEGHYLKNATANVYKQLVKIPAEFRLLLTGTPLQNNLGELVSLLGFMLPGIFRENSEALQSIFSHKSNYTVEGHSALLSAQRIARARSMMTPFVLRRKKYQVRKDLPPKTRRVVYCDLSESQAEIYEGETERVRKIIKERESGMKSNAKEKANTMMNLRKASIHPLLFRRIYDDEVLKHMARDIIKDEEFQDRTLSLVEEDMGVMTDFELHNFCMGHPDYMLPYILDEDKWMDSGKVTKLCELLIDFKARGDRVLIFSQFVMVMDILETVMENLRMKYFRLDGSTDINERQTMIDEFYANEDITVFLLSTKAGGAGINLACANKVIIFDSSFNPQDDIQAENRAHRVGQTRDVEVIRLVTRGTIEEKIYALGETKLALDDRVAGEASPDETVKNLEKAVIEKVEEMILKEL